MIVHKSQLTQLFTNRKCQFAVVVMLAFASQAAPSWPAVTRDMRPWCYNWWMGSAVDAKGLEAQADALAKAGFGGFHAIPIYGAKGWEAKYREFLSPDWMAAFADAVRIGNSRDLGVDLTMGSGWCFGGPQLTPEEGCWKLFVTANEATVEISNASAPEGSRLGVNAVSLSPYFDQPEDQAFRLDFTGRDRATALRVISRRVPITTSVSVCSIAKTTRTDSSAL